MTISDLMLADFGDLTVAYDEQVLCPRPWTFAQSAWSAELLESAPVGPVLELCAGVGHIGLAAVAHGRRELVLVDVNPAACTLAQRNAAAALMQHRVEVREGPMLDVLAPTERFAHIIADPPWVPSEGIGEHPADPAIAIDGGADGLDLARMCCEVIESHLAEGGTAVMQLGSVAQVDAIAEHLERTSSLRVRETRLYERGALALLAR